MVEILTPHEATVESLLQLLACLIDKLGGEIVISRRDFEMCEGLPVFGRHISKDYVLFRIAYEDEVEDSEEITFPEETPQT